MGVHMLCEGVWSGLKGVVTQPIQGVKDGVTPGDKVVGAASGLLYGVLGTVCSRPPSA